MRDHLEGAWRIKEKGTSYLPFLGDENDRLDQDAYKAYKKRALYLEATKRSHQALAGAITWKDPVLHNFPEQHLPLLESVTLDGHRFVSFSDEVVKEVMAVGRAGVLVELPEGNLTPAEASPYMVLYQTEDVINWRTERHNGKQRLVLVVLREMEYVTDNETDEFSISTQVRYRILRLRDGVYTQEVWEEVITQGSSTSGKTRSISLATEEFAPNVRGRTFEEIPFIFFTPDGNVFSVPDIPLFGIAEINTSHYITSADLEHGRHFTALPQPWISGLHMKDGDPPLRIGSGNAWIMDDPQASAGYLEFSGTGLRSLEVALVQKEQQMAMLGAQVLEGTRPGVVAAETARINQAGESSSLATIASGIESSMTKLIRTFLTFLTETPETLKDVRVEMNKDFVDQRLDSTELTGLINAYVNGGISYETLFANLKQGEIVSGDTNMDEEKERIRMDREAMNDLLNAGNPPQE